MSQGIVLYTDGGCRPNPGPGGWGMHGYMYSDDVPKKGSGNSNSLLTAKGYVSKVNAAIGTEKHVEVTPIHIINGYGSLRSPVTNNIAEIEAALAALKHAAEYDVQEILIWTDSQYLRQGLESWVDGWIRNNWTKRDGTEISNISNWKALVEARDILVARGVKVKIQWIRSHSDLPGNVEADHLATVGVMTSRANESLSSVVVTAAEGYWGYSSDRHPFINNRRMYFNTQTEFNKPGVYCLGEHGKDDDMIGKRISDGAFSLVRLEQPDDVLEMLRGYQIKMAGETDSLMMACLDHLYRPETHRELVTHGEKATTRPEYNRLDLICLDEKPLTRELRPVKIAMRAVEAIEELTLKLDKYLANDPSIVVTDLTPILYEVTLKPSKKGEPTTIVKLKPEYNVGFAALKVDANYQAGDQVAAASVMLTLGIDLLDRNALKRLEGSAPKVTLISWNEAPGVFRYATVIEAGADKGIWAGVYSNLRIVT